MVLFPAGKDKMIPTHGHPLWILARRGVMRNLNGFLPASEVALLTVALNQAGTLLLPPFRQYPMFLA
jgi:hypothetical protein